MTGGANSYHARRSAGLSSLRDLVSISPLRVSSPRLKLLDESAAPNSKDLGKLGCDSTTDTNFLPRVRNLVTSANLDYYSE